MPIFRRAVVATVFVAMAWLAAEGDDWRSAFVLTGQKGDYYNLLVDGFQKGQLHMVAEVHPDVTSPDLAVRRRAPYFLDAALFKGRYYLYYGVVPAVLLFLPYSFAFGHDLPPNAAVLLLVALGFLFAIRTLNEACDRYFPGIGRINYAILAMLLGFGTVTPSLLIRSAFYEVPIAGAYCFACIGLFCLYRLVHAHETARAWFAGASLAFALAIGCRPNLGFGLVVVGLMPFALGIFVRRDWLKWVGALLPTVAVGIGLAAYNYARFGNPLEFGFKYGMNEFFHTGKPFASAAFIWPNLRWYYFTPPVLSPYFPYVFPIKGTDGPAEYYSDEAIHGQWLLLLLGVVVITACIFRRDVLRDLPRLKLFTSGLLLLFALVIAFMMPLGVRANRYMVDFQAPLILCIAIVVGIAGSRNDRLARWQLILPGIAVALCLAVALFNVCAALQLFGKFKGNRPATYRTLAYLGNFPSHAMAKAGLLKYGPVQMTVQFVPTNKTRVEPLLATGTPNETDVLYATHYPHRAVALSILHEGYGGPAAESFPIDYWHRYEIVVDMASLYPPREHPFFDGWKPEDIERVKTSARVAVDGRNIITTRMAAYDAPPGSVERGRNPAGNDPPFSGVISDYKRLAASKDAVAIQFRELGVWRLQVQFPFSIRNLGQPILGSGVSGAGNLLYVDIVDEGAVRFGIDFWSVGIRQSPVIKVAPTEAHVLEIFAGPQVVKQAANGHLPNVSVAAVPTTFRLWLDGEMIWETPILAHPDSYEFVTIGMNPQGFSTAPSHFSGIISKQEFSTAELQDFIARNLSRAVAPP